MGLTSVGEAIDTTHVNSRLKLEGVPRQLAVGHALETRLTAGVGRGPMTKARELRAFFAIPRPGTQLRG